MKNIILLLSLIFYTSCFGFPRGDFYKERQAILKAENSSYLGSELMLTPNEQVANSVLMAKKYSELDSAFIKSYYPPSESFFQSKQDIQTSQVFDFIKSMPKGAALHTHDLSIASIDWVVSNLTYRDNLYMCEAVEPPKFGWFNSPDPATCNNTQWKSVQDKRVEMGPEEFDVYLKSLLVINVDKPSETYPHINDVWSSFREKMATLIEMINYQPVFRDYFYQAIQEFYDDNVQLLEVRTVLVDQVCTKLDTCDPLNQMEVAALYHSVANEFVAKNPDFCGVNMIFAPIRGVSEKTVESYLVLANKLIQTYPRFFIGFDLVGQEDLGRPLIDFADVIINATNKNPNLKFYFHAGETNWQGESTDINVIDALLLGAQRIGHGFSIIKHPEAMRIAVENDVPIEVCPISNQVLGLVDDLRNHPAAPLIQESFPVVISSDDPAIWDGLGLSFDFYEVFMSLAGREMDLRLLKKLVFDSVRYSGLDEMSKKLCRTITQKKWDDYMSLFASKNVDDNVDISVYA